MIRRVLLALFAATPSLADSVVPAHPIRAQTVIGPGDVIVDPAARAGTYADPALVIGQEARVTLYPGRPIRLGEVGPAALVNRHDIVQLRFRRGGLSIVADGRALGRGAAGDIIRVMNLASRATLYGEIRPDGTILVQ